MKHHDCSVGPFTLGQLPWHLGCEQWPQSVRGNWGAPHPIPLLYWVFAAEPPSPARAQPDPLPTAADTRSSRECLGTGPALRDRAGCSQPPSGVSGVPAGRAAIHSLHLPCSSSLKFNLPPADREELSQPWLGDFK